ncbi:MAG: DNA-processing protein DprA [Lactobacillaceae bacterium]|jgi:DNA processing protein|nr:DNA-processing protein DprA [Lactobacillaceae bacterium]
MEDLTSILQLINTDGVGPITFYKLIDMYGSAKEAIKNLPKRYNVFAKSTAQHEIELAKAKNIKIIAYKDNEYPDLLRELEDAPPILYAKGNIELLKHPLAVSIVGARNASINGRKTISKISYDLTNNDILVVSGMARGIDTAAHRGAMHAKDQIGPTIAVLGTGVDVIYPKENKELYKQIVSQGLIISEFPLGSEPQSANFPRRNRIVAGLAIGTLVGEASINSGSLITARLALEQGKDIFAIPGTPNDSRSSGPNKLIKEGAVLVEDANDIINIISNTNTHKIRELKCYKQENLFTNSLDKSEKNVNIPETAKTKKTANIDLIDYITVDGVDIDDLIRASNSDAALVSVELLNLELSGKIVRKVGNKVALASKSSGRKG